MSKTKKVIFLADIEGVAKKGEVKEVGEAFARNFLLAKQKALVFSRAIDKQLQRQEAKLREQQVLQRNKEEEIFTSINQQKLTFLLREKNGKTFGSVNALNITKALKEKFSVQISKENLLSFKPLQRRGLFPVAVRVNKNLTAILQVIVESSQEKVKIR